jgi:hypothetical protein
MRTLVRSAIGAVVVLASLLIGPPGSSARPHTEGAELTGVASAPTGGGAASPDTGAEGSGGFYWGAELRNGRLYPCSTSTPAPCSGFWWRIACPVNGVVRVTSVETYMGAEGRQFVGYTLQARLVRRGQSAAGVPWVGTTLSRPPGGPFSQRFIAARNVSDSVPTRWDWDLLVQLRWDRNGSQPDVVRTFREHPTFSC